MKTSEPSNCQRRAFLVTSLVGGAALMPVRKLVCLVRLW
jgi:hypothetical protein